MRTTSYILCWMLLLGLGVESAAARVITVSVTAHVASLYDPTNISGGHITNGMAVTGTYAYDTNIPNQAYPNGQYTLSAPPDRVSVSVGTFTFQSLPGSQSQTTISVNPSLAPGGQFSNMQIQSLNDQVMLQSGAVSAEINFDFNDNAGQWPTSNLLPTGAPALQSFSNSMIFVGTTAGSPFGVAAQIDSVRLVPSPLEASPESSSFGVRQHFDVALVLPAGAAQVVSVQANPTVAPGATGPGLPPPPPPGFLPPLPFSYPGQCQPAPATSTGRQVILCPNADQALQMLAGGPIPPPPPFVVLGPFEINWQVGLADGTFLYQTVVWNLIQ